MTMAPYQLSAFAGSFAYFAIFLLLGMGFGAVLELSGFGDSRKLSAQFYLRDMTVLKVMFTGIIVAAVLIHLASALQLLDLSRVWINPTYLVPGIVGGLIMGVGFIVGGFCPGTSLVAASTLKLDGVMFVLGGLFGALLFGESVHAYNAWWHSTFFGRFTLSDWLGLPVGVVVLLLVLMAVGVFFLAERAEAYFGGKRPGSDLGARGGAGISVGKPSLTGWRGGVAAGALVLIALVVALKGQPNLADRWRWIAPGAGAQVASRAIYVDPAEVVDLRRDLTLSVRILEVRSEADYNLFHLAGSERISLDDTRDPGVLRDLLAVPDNTILLLASNGEGVATEAWKRLKAQGVLNLYVVDGGVNHWLEVYPPNPRVAQKLETPRPERPSEERLRYRFLVAVGERCPSAHPDFLRREPPPERDPAAPVAVSPPGVSWFDGSQLPQRDYTKKVKIQKKVAPRGGCG